MAESHSNAGRPYLRGTQIGRYQKRKIIYRVFPIYGGLQAS